MTAKINAKLFDFIKASPTAFHTVENIKRELVEDGFAELLEYEKWDLCEGGKYFVTRNDSSIIAFRLPRGVFKAFQLMAAHGDSPAMKLKQEADVKGNGYTRLNIEVYGGPILSSWLDRPLSIAGRVVVEEGGAYKTRLVDLKRESVLIPSVAVHMDRASAEGKPLNPNIDLLPLLGGEGESLKGEIAKALKIDESRIISTDLFVYNRQEGTSWGVGDCFVSAPRLDDLQCAYALTRGFIEAGVSENADVLCVFDNEEVGSSSRQGADSSFLRDVLERICQSLGRFGDYKALIARSFMISADNAHAIHPNHPEYADRIDQPKMNEGIVIKFNSNLRYTTDALSAAVLIKLCERAGVGYQRYTNRADIRGGSTLGNISQTQVPLLSADIGLAQLSMHSTYETAGAKDTESMIKLAREFYSSSLQISKEGFAL